MKLKISTEDRGKSYLNSLTCIVLFFSITSITSCKSNFPEKEYYQVSKLAKHPVFTLGAGDSIRIKVYEHDNLSGAYNIDDTGRISMPLILGVNTKGMTLTELEQNIVTQLSNNFIINPKVSIDLIKSRPFCILGEVRNPGCFSRLYGMTSAQAIALAGGYTYRAYKEKFAVTREDGSKVVADISTPIFVGDTIEVYERYF